MPVVIKMQNVTRTYRLGDEVLNALDNVTFSVASGEFVAITGPSGSGKSTLANIIGGLDRPTSGTVIVDGNDLSHVRDRQLSDYRSQHVGFVFQSFNLQGAQTALENVMLPLVFARMKAKERKARATECLEAVGLGDRLKHKPSQLSGGQRQRVAIARALATKPGIIIADEPTGNLDSARGEEIMKLLRDLNKQGITLIIITHDLSIARQAGRVVQIKDGHLMERAKIL
jgi:putative ABC transport system ATP-binding protein